MATDPILFILAGNEDMHKISNEFEFWPDRTTDYGVSCPWASKKLPIDLKWENGVAMLACSFLIESLSELLVTGTGIKAQSSSILGRIKPLISELLALEWQKFHTFELEYLWSQSVNLDQILCVASLGWGKGCIRFWGRLTWHIGLRWAIVALWATCWSGPSSTSILHVCEQRRLWLICKIWQKFVNSFSSYCTGNNILTSSKAVKCGKMACSNPKLILGKHDAIRKMWSKSSISYSNQCQKTARDRMTGDMNAVNNYHHTFSKG